jgi:hypothetical protein
MNPVTAHFSCPPDQVFAVLADGWLYPSWVVGAARMRDVDESWPAEGSMLHHSVGSWPVMLDDSTTVIEWSPPSHMVLKARGWPLGTAKIRISVEAASAGCAVTIEEDALEGPGRLVPKPLRAAAIKVRNVETLKRLAFIAENR